MPNIPLATLVAEQTKRKTKTLRSRAAASARMVEAERQAAISAYGAATGAAISRRFGPAGIAAGVGVQTLQSRVSEARAGVQTAKESAMIAQKIQPLMRAGFAGLMKRTEQAGAPALISASAAMSNAKEVAKQIDLEWKTMTARGKTELAMALVNIQADRAKAVLDNELEIQKMEHMFNLQRQADEDDRLRSAPLVVGSIASVMPSLINDLKNAPLVSTADTTGLDDPGKWAALMSQKYGTNQASQEMIMDIAGRLAASLRQREEGPQGKGFYSWARNIVVDAVMGAYPGYLQGRDTISSILNYSVMHAAMDPDDLENWMRPGVGPYIRMTGQV